MRTFTDQKLIADSVVDPERFGLLFERHYEKVFRYLNRRGGRELAEEATSETFVIAFRQRGNFRSERTSALPWLLGIATNLISRERRRQERQLRAYEREALATTATCFSEDEVHERLDAHSSRQELIAALLDLPKNQLDVLLLWAWGELSYEEIAEGLDVPPGTVRSRLSRARESLRPNLLTPDTASAPITVPETGGSA